jgi:hypothetical protein
MKERSTYCKANYAYYVNINMPIERRHASAANGQLYRSFLIAKLTRQQKVIGRVKSRV